MKYDWDLRGPQSYVFLKTTSSSSGIRHFCYIPGFLLNENLGSCTFCVDKSCQFTAQASSHAAIFVSVISKTEIVMALQFWMGIKNFYGQSGNRKSSTECRNVLPR